MRDKLSSCGLPYKFDFTCDHIDKDYGGLWVAELYNNWTWIVSKVSDDKNRPLPFPAYYASDIKQFLVKGQWKMVNIHE